jgi:tyrosine-protein kinase Etk/Wzc
VLLAFIRRALSHGIENPELIEGQFNIPVYATVPHSDRQTRLLRRIKRHKLGEQSVLAVMYPNDLAIESLRSLRTSIHFALIDAKSNNNVILITGPTPGIGKSFVSVNFATILAGTGKRVLIIDADMRKGHIQQYFGLVRTPGLSDLILDPLQLEQTIHQIPIENLSLDLLTTGKPPPNPSELLLHRNLEDLITKLSSMYDYVLIDSPPILAVTDAAILGRISGTVLMVIKSGEHHLKQIELSIKRLTQAGINPKGMIFNDVLKTSRGYGKYGYKYGYKYGGKYAYNYSYKSVKS